MANLGFMSIFRIFLIIALISYARGQNCPNAQEIAPCSCDREGIVCFKLDSLEQLERVFKAKIRQKAALAVRIIGTPIKSIDANTFNGFKVANYHIDNNKQLETVESGAFDGSENVLHSISFYKCALIDFPFQGKNINPSYDNC